jgi:O-antigen ligase
MPGLNQIGAGASAARALSSQTGWRYNRLTLRTCVALVYWLGFGDFVIKFLPESTGLVLRYVPEALLYGLAATAFLSSVGRAGRRFPMTGPLAAFLAVAAASILANHTPLLPAASDFRTYFRFVAFAYVVSRLDLDRDHLRFLFRQSLIVGGIQMLVGASEILIGEPARSFFTPVTTPLAVHAATWLERPMTGLGFITGTLSNYNHFGILMVMVFTLALDEWAWRRNVASAGMAVASLVAAVLSYSRHTLLCIFATVLILLLLHKRRVLAAALVATPLLAAAVALVIAPTVAKQVGPDISPMDRLMNTFTEGSMKGDPTENVRLFFLLVLPGRFLSTAPVLGMGPGAIAPTSELRVLGEGSPSNGSGITSDIPEDLVVFITDVVWIVALGTYGLAGLLAIAYVFASILREALALRRAVELPEARLLAEVVIAWTVALILAGFFSMEVIARDTVPVFWLFVGAVFALRRQALSPVAVAAALPVTVLPSMQEVVRP